MGYGSFGKWASVFERGMEFNCSFWSAGVCLFYLCLIQLFSYHGVVVGFKCCSGCRVFLWVSATILCKYVFILLPSTICIRLWRNNELFVNVVESDDCFITGVWFSIGFFDSFGGGIILSFSFSFFHCFFKHILDHSLHTYSYRNTEICYISFS